MKYFTELNDLPIFDLLTELDRLNIEWPQGNQICLNTVKGHEDDYILGNGSLVFDWDKQYFEIDEHGMERSIVPKREYQYDESDFNILCSVFVGTQFEIVYRALEKKYNLGRVRLMKSKPKTCLSWHVDTNIRVHYPIKTQEGCFMVIDNEIKHLPKYTWWETNTIFPHTVFNASSEDRVHLVISVLSKK